MKQKRTLDNYGLNEYPKLIRDVIKKRVKLTALIQQQPDLYFLPETVLDGGELNTFENEQRARKMCQPSVTGEYEMTDNASIVKSLKILHKKRFHSEFLVLKGLKLPDGVIGCFITAIRHRRSQPEYRLARRWWRL